MAEHLEPSPLAKSEWLKFFALFFNREKIANENFDEIERNYNETKAKVQENFARVSYRPKVLVNYRSGDSWQVYGGQNAFAQLITDAGGDYLFTEGRGIPRSLLRFRFLFLSSNTPSACCGVVYSPMISQSKY